MSAPPRPSSKSVRTSRSPKPAAEASPREVRPRTKPAEVRREELLDAAERLFLAKGLTTTSVDDIVTAADVAKGTFYLHFASKEALLVGLQQRFVSNFCTSITKAVARRRPDDWKGKLRTWVQASLTSYHEQLPLHDVVFHDFSPHDRGGVHDNPVIHDLAALLTQGAAAGAFQISDAKLTALMLFHALHGAADAAVLAASAAEAGGSDATFKSLTRAIETFFLRAAGVE